MVRNSTCYDFNLLNFGKTCLWKILCVCLRRMCILLLWIDCLDLSTKFFCSKTLFKCNISYSFSVLTFPLLNGLLKYITIIDCCLFLPFSHRIYLIYLVAPMLGAYIFTSYILLKDYFPYILC